MDAAPNAASAASKSGTWILFEIIADVFIRLKTCALRRRSLPDHAFLYEVRAELYMNAMCICVKSGREISKIQTTYGFDFWVKFSGFCWFGGGTVLVLPIYRALRVTTLEVSPKGANAVAALYPLDPRDGSGQIRNEPAFDNRGYGLRRFATGATCDCARRHRMKSLSTLEHSAFPPSEVSVFPIWLVDAMSCGRQRNAHRSHVGTESPWTHRA